MDSAIRLGTAPSYRAPVSIADLAEALPGEALRPLRWSELEPLIALGAFDDDEPFELLEGALVVVLPEGPPHSWGVQVLNRLLARGLPEHLAVRISHPWIASEISVPGPDVAVVPAAYYGAHHPSDALLIVEVSVTSLRKDLGIKATIYAGAGVPEYWVVDPAHRLVHVHARPVEGRYASVVQHGEDAVLDALGVAVPVADILPRA